MTFLVAMFGVHGCAKMLERFFFKTSRPLVLAICLVKGLASFLSELIFQN